MAGQKTLSPRNERTNKGKRAIEEPWGKMPVLLGILGFCLGSVYPFLAFAVVFAFFDGLGLAGLPFFLMLAVPMSLPVIAVFLIAHRLAMGRARSPMRLGWFALYSTLLGSILITLLALLNPKLPNPLQEAILLKPGWIPTACAWIGYTYGIWKLSKTEPADNVPNA